MAVQFGGNGVYNISFNGTSVNAAFFNNNLVFSRGISSSTLTVTSDYVVSNILYPAPQEWPDYWQEPIMTVLDLKNQLDQSNATLHVYDQNNNEKLDTAPACTKDTIVFSINGAILDTKKFIQKGDLNCDGTIDIEDERIIIAHDTAEGPHITDPDILYAADINDDGDIDFRDRGYVINYCARDIANGISVDVGYARVQGSFLKVNFIYGRDIPAWSANPITVSGLKNLLQQDSNKLHVYDYSGNELSANAAVGTKMIVKYVSNGSILDVRPIVIKGDVDGDGYISVNDYSMIKDIVDNVSQLQYTEFEKRDAANVNNENNTTMADAELVKLYFMGDYTQLETNSTYVDITSDYVIVNVVKGQGAPSPKDPPLTVLELKNLMLNTNSDLHVYDTSNIEVQDSSNVATKMKMTYVRDNIVVDEKVIVLVGDVNNDGAIDMIDYGFITNHINGSAKITDPVDLIAADVNEDGYITIADSTAVRNYYQNS